MKGGALKKYFNDIRLIDNDNFSKLLIYNKTSYAYTDIKIIIREV